MMMKYSANVFALCLYEWTDEEGSGPLAMIIIPSLLALSTLIVVSQIIWSFVTKRLSAQVITASSSNVNGMWKRQQFEPKCQFIFSFIAWFFETNHEKQYLLNQPSFRRGARTLGHRRRDSAACTGSFGCMGDTYSVHPGGGWAASDGTLWANLQGSAKTRQHIHCCSD